MRPVVRGDCPKNQDNTEIKYSDFPNARGALINRLGEFCSYCEMRLEAGLAVEHIQPKKPDGATGVISDRESDWQNFLLACPNCNSTKGNTEVIIEDYYWPDRDNTFRALQYSVDGIIKPDATLSNDEKLRADATIKLTGLDKQPLNNPKASDRRWLNRRDVWNIAQKTKHRLTGNSNNTDFRETIVDVATGHGHWSIWMTVFKDDADMLRRFINAFSGTCHECFDDTNQYFAIARQGGQI